MQVKKTLITKIIVGLFLLFTLWNLILEISNNFTENLITILSLTPLVVFQVVSLQKILLLIALLIILLTKSKYLLKCLNFFKAFKKINDLLIILVIDAAFFGLTYLLIINSSQLFKKITITSLSNQQELLTNPSIMINYLRNVSIIVLGVLIALFILYTLSRAVIWKVLVDKNFSYVYLSNFIKYNFLWLLFWIIPLTITVFGILPQFKNLAITYLTIFYTHFTQILHYSIANEKKIMKNFASLSLEKFYYLLTPYSLMPVGYFIVTSFFKLLIPQYHFYTSAVIFLLTIACFRVYLTEILNWLKK